jgi:hypothetical protein
VEGLDASFVIIDLTQGRAMTKQIAFPPGLCRGSRKNRRPGRSDAMRQAAKTTLFAAGKLCRVSKKSPQAIFSNE